jgi:hypothetical protein
MVPAVRAGRHSATFKIERSRTAASLGACYHVGVCSARRSSWKTPVNGGGDAIGMEDDNTQGPGKWKLPSSQTVDGRAFKSGDLITLEADFDADTITFWRNKGGVGGSPEVGNQGGCNNYGH